MRKSVQALIPRGGARAAAMLALSAVFLALAPDAGAASRKKQPPPERATKSEYAARPEVREFARYMAGTHGFAEEELLEVFSKARRSDRALKLIAPPPPTFKRSWAAYRDRFLDSLRIEEGVRFWNRHRDDVARASQAWGVPEEIVVSIIGVETLYGRVTGDFRVLDALTTLAFDYPRRADYFRSELEQYLLLAREQNVDAFSMRGSFAGAVGLPQFMPGSIRRFAVDFDGDGRIDLRNTPADAIGSVAKFLADHGWRPGEPTHFDVRIGDEAAIPPLIEAGIKPSLTGEQLAALGVSAEPPLPEGMAVALIDLPNADAPTSYYLGANNFYVITRYNRSSFYAMAVIELARALREAR